jgi:hypothetical protein
MAQDEIQFEILPNGDVKLETGKISGANHMKAENVLRLLEDMYGAKGERTRARHAHAHDHEHTHDQERH